MFALVPWKFTLSSAEKEREKGTENKTEQQAIEPVLYCGFIRTVAGEAATIC